MIPLNAIYYILVVHWFADFVMQSHWMASNKSSSNRALLAHIVTYTFFLSLIIHPVWGLVNGVLHGITDYFTSRWTSSLWKSGNTHNFFVVIGLDQMIHAITLFATYYWIVL